MNPGSSSRMRVKSASWPRSIPTCVPSSVMRGSSCRLARCAQHAERHALPQSLRPLVNQIKATTSLEDIRGQGCDRVAGAGRQVQDRKGFALSALRARRRPRHHQRAIRAEPAHRRAEAVGARRGAKGVFINHEASRTSNDCYVCEIAPGKKLEPQHHLFEEMILVLAGRGSTTVWNDAGARITFEWKAGAIFAIPLNCWYQHFNGSGQEPARYVAVTNAPSVINLYDDVDFVFNHQLRLQEPLLRRGRLFQRQGRADRLPAADQFRRRRRQPAADHRQGARRRRRPYPLQHGARARSRATSRSSRSAPTRRRMRTGRAPTSSCSRARAIR